MSPPNVYIDAPELDTSVLSELQAALLAVPGVRSVELVDILPGDRRRLQLDTLLAAMRDPTVAVDGQGVVLLANPAFCSLVGHERPGGSLDEFLDDSPVTQLLKEKEFRLGGTEVVVRGHYQLCAGSSG